MKLVKLDREVREVKEAMLGSISFNFFTFSNSFNFYCKLKFIYCRADVSKDTVHSTKTVDVLIFAIVLVPVDKWSSLRVVNHKTFLDCFFIVISTS